MVMTRWPRRWSSAASRTTRVVFPAFLRPMIATSGGFGGAGFGGTQLLGCVDVHEDALRLAVARDLACGQADQSHRVEKRDHAAIAAGDRPLDSWHARRRVPGAQ